MEISLPAGVYVVANQSEVARLQAAAGGLGAGFTSVPLPPAAPVPGDVVAHAELLVVEVDPGDRASMRRVAQVRAARADLPLIVAIPEANVALVRTLIRQGVSDVATIPFAPEELAGQLLDLAARQRQQNEQPSLASLTSIVRSTGGCGATTVTTHLAAAMARAEHEARSVCVVDLDIQFGTVASFLGVRAKISISELLEAGERIDADLLRSAAIESVHGYAFIAAPEPITPLEMVDTDQLLRLLNVARLEYGHVLLDFPANWTNWTLSAALASTDVILLTDLTIPGLRQAKRRLQLFDSVGIPRESVRVVVNRMENRLFRTIGVEEVHSALGHEVFATLASEPSVLHSAQDQGMLAGEINRKSRFARDIADLADKLSRGRV